MRARFLIGAMAIAASFGSALAMPFSDKLGGPVLSGRTGRAGTTKHGKRKLRRHGQKLKSCRIKIGRRVRRKHRKAAA